MSARRHLLGVAVLFVVNGAALGSWLPRLPELRDRLGLTLAEVGLVLAAGGFGGLAASMLSGRVVGRIGPRWTAVAPAALLMALLPAVGVAPVAPVLALVVALAGASDAVADVGMNALAVRVEEARGRSILNRLHALWSIGSFGGSALSAAAIAAGIALSTQLLFIGALGVAAVAIANRMLPDPPPRPRPRPRARAALALAAAGLAAALVEGAPTDWSAIYLTDVVGASATVAGVGFLVYMGGMLTGRTAGDAIVDRVGTRPAIVSGFATTTTGLLLVLLGGGAATTMVGFALWGLGVSVVFPMLYRVAGAHRGFGEGSGLAAMTAGSRIGFLTGPAAIGAIAGATGLAASLGIVVGAGIAISLLLVWLRAGQDAPGPPASPHNGVSAPGGAP